MTHQTLHVIVSTHWFVFLASGWPVSHRKLITSLCSSAIYICRKAFVMSAMNAMGCNLKLTTTLRSGFRSSEQSLRDGQPFSCAEASKMTLSLVVAFSFLSQHGEVSSTGCYDFLPQMWTLLTNWLIQAFLTSEQWSDTPGSQDVKSWFKFKK